MVEGSVLHFNFRNDARGLICLPTLRDIKCIAARVLPICLPFLELCLVSTHTLMESHNFYKQLKKRLEWLTNLLC